MSELRGIDDDPGDDPADDGERTDNPDTDGHVCPECGESFGSKIGLGAHRRAKHGVLGINAKKERRERAPRRNDTPRPAGSRSKRATLVEQTLKEVADLIERRGDNVDAYTFAQILRRDADKIGSWLAALAERRMFAGLGPIIDNLFGDGGPLSAITALGPTLRKLLSARPRRERDSGEDHPSGLTGAQLQAEFERIMHEEGEDKALRWAALNGIEVAAA